VGDAACSSKNFPRSNRKDRRPEVNQPQEASQEQPTPSEKAELPLDPTIQEPGEPGGAIPVLGAPTYTTSVFHPHPQNNPTTADRYALSLKGSQGHPRLYFNSGELRQLQAQATSTHKEIADRIFAYGERQGNSKKSLPPSSMGGMPKSPGTWRKVGDRLLGLATAYALTTTPTRKDKYLAWCTNALHRLTSYSKWGPEVEYDVDLDGSHIMLGFAFALDVTYDALSQADQRKFQERLRVQADRLYKATQARSPLSWVGAKNVNHNYINHNALLNAALVLENHYPEEAKKWIAVAVKNTEHVMDFREAVGDGSSHEGVMYASYGSHALFITLDLLKKHGLADHFDNPWLREHFSYLLHGTRPGWGRVVGISDGHGFFGHGPHHLLYFMDRIMRDGRPTWASNQIRRVSGDLIPFGKPEGSTLFYELLWRDPTIEPKAITTENTPTFHHFEDWGVLLYRRNWSENSTYFSFRAGDPPGHAIWKMLLNKNPRAAKINFTHSHPDAGSFSFYPGGKDFISGALYEMPKRTALGSTYTFTPKVPFSPPVPKAMVKRFWDLDKLSQVGRLDELGQAGEWNRWYGPPKAVVKAKVHAEIVSAVESNDALFVSGEIAEAYPRTFKSNKKNVPFGLQRLYRNMLLLPDDVLVIVDRVTTNGPLEAHCYFRSESSPDSPVLWTTAGNKATLKSSKSGGSAVDVIHPTGISMSTGLEIYSWEDAKDSNKGGIKNWGEVEHSSAYVRVSNAQQSGTETYVYLLRPNGKAARVFDLNFRDPRGVSVKIEIGGRIYSAKIAMDLSQSSRQAFLGFDGHCKLDYIVK
jgi:hypothetical protein